MLLNCGVGEDFRVSLGQQRDPTSPSYRKSVLNIHWNDWCWSWNSNTLATWCEELTHLKRPWCRERLSAGGGGDDRGWDGWMAPPTQWTWVWVTSGSWWWTGRPGVLVHGVTESEHDWATELNWTEPLDSVCLMQYLQGSSILSQMAGLHSSRLSRILLDIFIHSSIDETHVVSISWLL